MPTKGLRLGSSWLKVRSQAVDDITLFNVIKNLHRHQTSPDRTHGSRHISIVLTNTNTSYILTGRCRQQKGQRIKVITMRPLFKLLQHPWAHSPFLWSKSVISKRFHKRGNIIIIILFKDLPGRVSTYPTYPTSVF